MRPPVLSSRLALTILYVVVLGGPVGCSREEDAPPPRPEAPVYDRFLVRGVSHTASEEGRRIFSFEADEMIHRKRKVGPLTINPVKEMELTGVKLAIYRSTNTPPSMDSDPAIPLKAFVEKVGATKNLGLVSRILINDLEISVYRDDALQVTLVAGHATASGDSVIDFEDGFRLTTAAGQELTARRARWDNHLNRLRIRGDYRLNDGGDVTTGTAARFALAPEGRILIMDGATDRP